MLRIVIRGTTHRLMPLGITAAAAFAALFAGIACGQTSPSPSPSPAASQADQLGQLKEVIVTAEKRPERLEDTPASLVVMSGSSLQQQQIFDMQGLTTNIPSLSYQQGTNATNTAFNMRGIGSDALSSQGIQPSVAVVVDGVAEAITDQGLLDFPDIERIEVLRGPQGTLFGPSATAGVINVVTAPPSRDFSGSVNASVAQEDEYHLSGTVTGPLTNTLTARLSGFYNDVGGYMQNLALHQPYGGEVGRGVHGVLDWDATDNLNFVFSGSYITTFQDCCRPVLVATNNPITEQLFSPVTASYNSRATMENVPTTGELDQGIYSLTGTLNLKSAALTSITALQRFHTDNGGDVAGINTPVPLYTGGGTNPAEEDYQVGSVDVTDFSEELRLASTDSSQRIGYVAGVFFAHDNLGRPYARRRALCSTGVIGEPCATADTTWQSMYSAAYIHRTTAAAFGQLQARIVGGLSLIAGLREQYDRLILDGVAGGPLYPGDQIWPSTFVGSGQNSASDTGTSGTLGTQYHFSHDSQLYATYTRGYKGIGYNTESTSDFLTGQQAAVKPENVNAYEVGFKQETANHRLRYSADVFLAKYTNLQIQTTQFVPASGIYVTNQTNAGSAKTRGFEIDGTWVPVDDFSLDAHVAYADARYSANGIACPLEFQATAPVLTGNFPVNTCFKVESTVDGATVTSAPIQDIQNGRLQAAPNWRISVTPRYDTELPINNLSAFGQFTATYTSDQMFDLDQDPLLRAPGYTLVDASIGVHTDDDRYTVSLFVQNLFNQDYVTTLVHSYGLQASTATPYDLYADFPKDSRRYFGINAGVKF